MDFQDQLIAAGCTLNPVQFRRILLDTFAEYFEPGELDDILTNEEDAAVFCAFLTQQPGCEDFDDDEFAVETLGRLLGDMTELLTDFVNTWRLPPSTCVARKPPRPRLNGSSSTPRRSSGASLSTSFPTIATMAATGFPST